MYHRTSYKIPRDTRRKVCPSRPIANKNSKQRVHLGQARFSVCVEILGRSWSRREHRARRPARFCSLLFASRPSSQLNSKCARVHKVPEKCVESARNASTHGVADLSRLAPFLPRTCELRRYFCANEKTADAFLRVRRRGDAPRRPTVSRIPTSQIFLTSPGSCSSGRMNEPWEDRLKLIERSCCSFYIYSYFALDGGCSNFGSFQGSFCSLVSVFYLPEYYGWIIDKNIKNVVLQVL